MEKEEEEEKEEEKEVVVLERDEVDHLYTCIFFLSGWKSLTAARF